MYHRREYFPGKYTQIKTRTCTIQPKVHLKQVCLYPCATQKINIYIQNVPKYLLPCNSFLYTLLMTQKYIWKLNLVFSPQCSIVEISTQYNRIIGSSDSSKSNEMSVMSVINLLKGPLDTMNAVVFVHKWSPNQTVKSHQ